jgi:leucyl-tRNA synthetase
LKDLDSLTEWPRNVKQLQRNWIGKSEGLEIDFGVVGCDQTLSVFTTRAETLKDVEFIAVSPYHPILNDKGMRSLFLTRNSIC